ncbi:hypothetical protein AB0941_26660 [Streptomyces sp. NPDC013433]|uniref:hypothetical protein n=1 Tax=Streptomyces sp. NPDC013433 TaxID=3155604 RepID=UPI0034569BFD
MRIASVGRLSVISFADRALRHLSVPDVVRLGHRSPTAYENAFRTTPTTPAQAA